MESISIIKGATSVKKEAEKVQRQKSCVFFAQIPPAFIQCNGHPVYVPSQSHMEHFVFCWWQNILSSFHSYFYQFLDQ